MTQPSPLFLYGIMRSSEVGPVRASTVGAPRDAEPQTIGAVEVGPLAILATPLADGTPRRTRRNMQAHLRVLELAMQHGTILPMRFGMVADTPEQLHLRLADRVPAFLTQLEDFDGRHEFTVRARWDRDDCLKGIVTADPDLQARSRRIQAGGGYQDRVELGRRVGDAIEAWRAGIQKALIARLGPLARRYAIAAPEDDMEVLRAHFLVTEAEEQALAEVLLDWQHETAGAGSFHCFGPSPVFNFLSVTLDDRVERRAGAA